MTVLMQKPNFLLLDEPTNDLDLFTIQLLEEYLLQFKGSVLVVSHDRFFIDKVVDHLLLFKENGEISDFPGNYSTYRESLEKQTQPKEVKEPLKKAAQTVEATKKKGLSYKEQQLFTKTEQEIKDLEQEKKDLELSLESGILGQDDLVQKSQRIGEVLALLNEKEMIWLELSEKM